MIKKSKGKHYEDSLFQFKMPLEVFHVGGRPVTADSHLFLFSS